jgi:SAM-dependent methyltransferase
MPSTKQYDQSYFDHWYRSRATPVPLASMRRKVRHAVAAAEFVLGREIRSVLDVGCGEGRWRGELKRMRRRLYYLGVDGSEYALRRFGKRRNIRKGTLGTLGKLGLQRKFDLIVCADVVYYADLPELRSGLRAIHRLLSGVAYIEAYTTDDEVEGDMEGWHHRSERVYRREFSAAGLVSCGLNCFVGSDSSHLLSSLERCC